MDNQVSNWTDFVLAGKAIFTIKNSNTGGHLTFKVKQAKQNGNGNRKLWFVSVLNGPNNNCNYTYIGVIDNQGFRLTAKSKVSKDTKSFRAFSWLIGRMWIGSLPEFISFFHEGRCGRCGKRLTVPESIESGFGPFCRNRFYKK